MKKRSAFCSTRRAVSATLVASLLTGCAVEAVQHGPPPEAIAFANDKPEPLRDRFVRLKAEGPRNEVLNNMILGHAAMGVGERDIAEQAFDSALQQIEAVYAENEKAAKARSLWHSESVKDFKGEPYERMMAYYYRGLLYLWRGDYENAQAAFKGAVLQTSFSEEERFAANAPIAIWLEGWANHCMKDKGAQELFKEAQAKRSDLPIPDPKQTWLFLAETGTGPTKDISGKYNQILKFKEGARRDVKISARAGTNTSSLIEAEDVYQEASSRGGRPIDAILAGKAAFKDDAQSVAQVASALAMATANMSMASGNSRGGGFVALGLLLVAAAATAAEAAANPEADSRTWNTLPHSILLAALEPPANPDGTKAEIVDAFGRSVVAPDKTLQVGGDARCRLAWVPASDVVPLPALLPTTVAGHDKLPEKDVGTVSFVYVNDRYAAVTNNGAEIKKDDIVYSRLESGEIVEAKVLKASSGQYFITAQDGIERLVVGSKIVAY
ncbi:MAG: hypothetical protein ABT940_01365 [Alphaproteobacteria bacterium]